MKTVDPKDRQLTLNRNTHDLTKLSTIIDELVVNRPRKSTAEWAHRRPGSRKNVKEARKVMSPLRTIMKNRNVQYEMKKPKRDVRIEPFSSCNGNSKSDKPFKENIVTKSRNGTLRESEHNNKAKILTPEKKISANGRTQGTKVGEAIKKRVTFTDQYDHNGGKTLRSHNTNEKVTKYSKFLEETHNNIKTLTDEVFEEADAEKEKLLNSPLASENKEPIKNCDLQPALWENPPLSFKDRITFGNADYNGTDVVKVFSEDVSVVDNILDTGSSDEKCSIESSCKEPDCSYECEHFIRTNFSVPVFAFGCISVVCILISKRI